MAKGISIHIGLNHIDEDYYGTDGELFGCINDANDMKAIATKLGYSSSEVITEEDGTKSNVVSAIASAADKMASGDTLLLTYSGHGSHVDDVDGDEPDGQDETWCLYDQMLIDDELRQLWARFKAGTRIFMLSDSCHSGTVARMLIRKEFDKVEPTTRAFLLRRKLAKGTPQALVAEAMGSRDVVPVSVYRQLPSSAQQHVKAAHGSELNAAQYVSGGSRAVIQTTVIQISGCQDYETSLDGNANGLFTEKLKAVWNSGAFAGGYRAFHQAILNEMPLTQRPNYDVVGAANAAFEAAKPFTIAAATVSTGTTAPAPGRPVITPLEASLSQGDAAPSFSVNPGAGKAYAIQWSTDPAYLYSIEGRVKGRNYFSTLLDRPLGYNSSYPIEVQMPQEGWDGLSAEGDRLYYRLWRSDSRNGLVNTVSSAPSQSTAPYVTISRDRDMADTREISRDEADEPSIHAVKNRVPNTSTPPSFRVNTGANRYYGVQVTTDNGLFDSAARGRDRTSNNFFASYSNETDLLDGVPGTVRYQLPQDVWDRFRKKATTLYYRLLTSSQPDHFEKQERSTHDRDASRALKLEIVPEAAPTRQATPRAKAGSRT
jgi:hypothetical protein